MTLQDINDLYASTGGSSNFTAVVNITVPAGVTVTSGSGVFPASSARPPPTVLFLFGLSVHWPPVLSE